MLCGDSQTFEKELFPNTRSGQKQNQAEPSKLEFTTEHICQERIANELKLKARDAGFASHCA